MKPIKSPKEFSLGLALAFISTCLFCQSVAAQLIAPVGVQPPVFSPSNPTADDMVRASIETRNCSIFLNAILDFPSTPTNGIITIQASGIISFDLAFCIYGIRTTIFELGRLPVGTQRVEVRMRDSDELPISLGLLVQVGSISVSPSQTPAVQVPTFQHRSLAAFVALALLLGIVAIRRQS